MLELLIAVPLIGLAVYVWLVWTGRFRWWFEGAGRGSMFLWPLPGLLLAMFLLAVMSGPLESAGLRIDGDRPVRAWPLLVWLALWLRPPRWLLPPWVRARAVDPPRSEDAPWPGALPALRTEESPGYVPGGLWLWRIDAIPGWLWVDNGMLRFRALDALDSDGSWPGPAEWDVPAAEDQAVKKAVHEAAFRREQSRLIRGARRELRQEMGRRLTREERSELASVVADEVAGHLERNPPVIDYRYSPGRNPQRMWPSLRRIDVPLEAVRRVWIRRPWRRSGLIAIQVRDRYMLVFWVRDAWAARRLIRGPRQ